MRQRICDIVDKDLASAYPETIVTALLRDALLATRKALTIANPEIADDRLDIGTVDCPSRLAFLLAMTCVDVDQLVVAYHRALRHRGAAAQIAQLDLPF